MIRMSRKDELEFLGLGRKPRPQTIYRRVATQEAKQDRRCPICLTYCDGDCQASKR